MHHRALQLTEDRVLTDSELTVSEKELCAAVLLSKLYGKVTMTLNIAVTESFL
jgi:hypothetical protein